MLVDGRLFREFDVFAIVDELKLSDKGERKTVSRLVDAPEWVFDLSNYIIKQRLGYCQAGRAPSVSASRWGGRRIGPDLD